jgi:hypothetical protein
VIDHRAARAPTPAGYVDSRVVEATRQAIAKETNRSTGTVQRLRRRVEKLLAKTTETGDRPAMPPERNRSRSRRTTSTRLRAIRGPGHETPPRAYAQVRSAMLHLLSFAAMATPLPAVGGCWIPRLPGLL